MAIIAPDIEQQTATEPASKPKHEAREYVILAAMAEPGEWWQLPDNGWGVNEQTAKDNAIAKLPPDEQTGTFVGVPVRSWKPRERILETRTRTRWS